MNIEWNPDHRPKPVPSDFATVNGEHFPTVVTGDGVQRFPMNRIIRDLLDEASLGRKMDLNVIWARAQNGQYCKAEVQELYRLIGTSVCGFQDVFEEDDVNSSYWT